jgi:hypothetical protein
MGLHGLFTGIAFAPPGIPFGLLIQPCRVISSLYLGRQGNATAAVAQISYGWRVVQAEAKCSNYDVNIKTDLALLADSNRQTERKQKQDEVQNDRRKEGRKKKNLNTRSKETPK